ncbi:hypothetical protein CGLO_13733 [Colletotrichum gloeosporioides Cg-14]|uniref:Uncharacterized protein n=1 Tax=Colletotrichum gloeosporioides (strain Cg-14) TaxID=1237896 RepID=T0JVW8_COLGC|nr:hypothetical protein CGLO_13733 [Colletotrichum gloeosporioides Cg-14]
MAIDVIAVTKADRQCCA